VRSWNIWVCGAAIGLLAGSPAAAISLGQVDDFQDGSVEVWGGGSSTTNVATGGPAGGGDRYLQISSAASNLGAMNQAQWTGDYAAAGVTHLRISLKNSGPDAVALRISLFGPGGTFTTTNETVLAAASGWVTADFALDVASLTRVSGSGTLAQTLADVTALLLRHDADPISPPGVANPVTATLGIDDIKAIPEPASGLLLALGIGALAARRQVAEPPSRARGSRRLSRSAPLDR
jgi:hypothetical protein